MPITPNLLLQVNIREDYQENDYWNEDDNTNDPYIGRAFRWQINLDIQTQYHGNPTTLTPYQYNGQDIQVGDWIASGILGKALKIVSIVKSDVFEVTLIVEDFERYNTFNDISGSGSGFIDTGSAIIFRMADDGLPILGSIPDLYLQPKAVEDMMARFIARNGISEFVLVNQENHGMVPGDVIYADFEANSGYKKTNAANISRAIGIVTETNVPGLDYFSYRPLGKLIMNVRPTLWGEHGDIFYLDPNEPGALTNEKPVSNAFPVYLQLEPTRAILLSRGVESSSTGPVTESETNKYDVENVTAGQTTFTMPGDAKEILYMAINGIENENFTFDVSSKVLQFDPIGTGYGVDVDDEVFFIYKT